MIAALYATYDEAAPLIALTEATECATAPVRLFQGQAHGHTLLIAIAGMGAEAARQTCNHLARRHEVDTIINLGICGALDTTLSPGEVYTIDQVLDANRLETAAPAPSASLRIPAWPGLPAITLGTVAEPVFDPTRRDALSHHCAAVDMEGWAVAEACRTLGLRCYMLKGISDHADTQGRDDLHRNLSTVSQQVAERFMQSTPPRVATSSSRWRHLHRFTRIEHTLFSLPLLFAGAWLGADGMPSLTTLVLIGVVGFGARSFGMAMNRILDRDLDARNPRTASRQLPAGQLSLLDAYSVAAVGLVAYLLGCAGLGPLCLLLAPVPLIPLMTYALLKRFTPLCHFGIGLCLALAPLGAFVASSGELPLRRDVLLLSGFTLLWMAGFDIIYALLDLESDRKLGVRSIPAALGTRGAQLVAGITHLAAYVLLALLWVQTGMTLTSGIALAIATGGFVAAYIPSIPVPVRFFPISVIVGIAGAGVVLLGS